MAVISVVELEEISLRGFETWRLRYVDPELVELKRICEIDPWRFRFRLEVVGDCCKCFDGAQEECWGK